MASDIVLRVLGPVEVRSAAAWSVPGTPQQRLVLALLALQPGHVVPTAELIDAIWDDDPPRSARASLQALVTRLRQALAPIPGSALDRRGDGYLLELEPERVDVHRFRSLAAAGRGTADSQAGVATFEAALALWRGPALADVPDTGRIRAIRTGLDEEHRSVAQDRIARMLACGRNREAAAELPAALDRDRLAERLAGMLMIALYRSGRRDDALRAFRDIRRRLAAELGVEPGPELQSLHRRILAGDADLADPVPRHRAAPGGAPGGTGRYPRLVPRQLPAAAAHFAGRDAELARLDELAASATGPGGQAAVWVIGGSAGIGKTTLAVRWAQRAARQFPDGQLYVNLKGFSPSDGPLRPAQAIRGFLHALGVPAAQFPESLQAQSALYRSVLADRRMLIVLDNARDEDQVRPLLPGSHCCPALITSRSQLAGLAAAEGAHLISLDLLSAAEARELLARRLGEQQVAAEPAAVSEIARCCDGLPLALAIAAARAAARPRLRLATLAAELRGRARRLDMLETGDAASSVRAVFSWSCRQLASPAARMFRLLSLHPGPDVSAPAAASLAGIPLAAARQALAELTRAYLLTEPAPGRFGCHDLLRAYAAEQERADHGDAGRRTAKLRMLDHYLHTANTAARHLYPARDPLTLDPPQPGTAPERPAGRAEALAWFGAEHQVLLTAAVQAAADGFDTHAWQLLAVLTDYLNRQGLWHDLALTGRIALAAAWRREDRQGQAHAHLGLGTASFRLGWHDEAADHLHRAVALFGELGDPARQARALVALGTGLDEQGRPAAARRHTEQALRTYRQLGHQRGEANALCNLGWYLARLGDHHSAAACCQQALDLHRELGNQLGEAHAWDHLGYARGRLGEHAAAIDCYRRALDLLQVISDRSEEAGVLARLGDSYCVTGDRELARAAWQQALSILDDLNDPAAARLRSRLGWRDGALAGREVLAACATT